MYGELQARHTDVLSVAVDMQGPEKPRPFHEKANAAFTTVVDSENLLGGLLGFKAVPNGLLLDEEGRIVFQRFGGFDIRKPEYAAVVRSFADDGLPTSEDLANEGVQVQSIDHFRRGLARLEAGDAKGAREIWREGVALEPDNWILRKQVWALDHPDKFYDGPVDFSWQKEQIAKGE